MWWIDIDEKKAFESRLDGGAVRTLTFAQPVGAVAPTRQGYLIAALGDGIYLIDPENGAPTKFSIPPEHDPKIFRFNDGKVDPRGRYWAGSLAYDDRREQSRLYRFDADGRSSVMHEGVSISNGLAWTADGTRLYYIDSPTKRVVEFPFDLERGTLGPPRTAITLGEADGWPDGCSMDAEDNLWVAHWGAAKLTRWEPRTGRLLDTIKFPVENVTSCAFGGEKLDQLFVTTARNAATADREPEAGYIFRVEPGVTGLPVAAFAGA